MLEFYHSPLKVEALQTQTDCDTVLIYIDTAKIIVLSIKNPFFYVTIKFKVYGQ